MIRITYAGVVLADGIPHSKEIVGPLTVNGTRAVDAPAMIRAIQPTYFDRRTNTNQIRFAVLEQLSTQARAFDRSLRGRQQLPGQGLLKIELTVATVTHRWIATRCAAPERPVETLGASATISYTLMAGIFSYAVSEPGESLEEYLGGRDLGAESSGRARGGRHLTPGPVVPIGGRNLAA